MAKPVKIYYIRWHIKTTHLLSGVARPTKTTDGCTNTSKQLPKNTHTVMVVYMLLIKNYPDFFGSLHATLISLAERLSCLSVCLTTAKMQSLPKGTASTTVKKRKPLPSGLTVRFHNGS